LPGNVAIAKVLMLQSLHGIINDVMKFNQSIPAISVILTTYNREKLLPTMLGSIKRQSFEDYELILVNNGSTDGTAKICDDYARFDDRVKLIHLGENTGASRGRNTGLAAASGEHIAFVDDDDRCEPSMLSFLMKLVEDYNADISMCGSKNEFPDNRHEVYFVCDEPFQFDRLDGLRGLLARKLYNVAPPTKLFKRSLWDGLSFPKNVLVDDIHVVYKAFERATSVAVWNKPLYFFKKHDTNMTAFIHNRAMSPELLDEYIDMYQKRAKYLLERAPEITADIEGSMVDFMKNMCAKIRSNEIKGCEKQLEFMQKYLRWCGHELK